MSAYTIKTCRRGSSCQPRNLDDELAAGSKHQVLACARSSLQGYLRVGLPFQLMQQYRWQAMVLSDVDVVWLQVRLLLLAYCSHI
jgi:hypothetical protein